jgi:tetratricopeptide (TPR) repeat protein
MRSPLEQLTADLRAGRTVVVAGASIARGATGDVPHASWKGLLESGVEYCRALDHTLDQAWEESVKRDIHSPRMEDLLSAAERISSILGAPGGGEYRSWLRSTIGQLQATDRRVLRALRDLQVPLTTTNYDGLLEEETGLPPITWRDGPRVVDWLQGEEDGILHWHGFWRDAESVVLGIRANQEIINDARTQAAIRALLATKVLLFVGFGAGLGDPNFTRLRKWMADFLAGARTCHYRLALRQELHDVEAEHAPDERIKVIEFGERFDDLAGFLQDLCPPRAKPPVDRTVQPAAPSLRIPPRPPCYGRKALIDRLANAIAGDSSKPIPILGGPALGKTTVAIATLYDLRIIRKVGDRRYFANCNGARSRADLVAKIGQALGVAHSPYPEDVVLATLASEPAMLVLDDADASLDADRDEVGDLLARLATVDGLALLVVFRGAQKPMRLDWHEPIHVLPLEPHEAREAFLCVAGTEHANDAFLASLLEAVGYVPYSVMMLGNLAQAEPDLDGLWTRWRTKRMEVLRSRWVSEEYQKMVASFEVSISAPCMDKAARRLLSILGMLPDGISPQEVAQVFPDLGDAHITLRRLALVFPREPRLRLHGLLREHVWESYPPDTDDRRRTIEYYANLAVQDEAGFGGKASDQAVSRFVANLGNIETVIQAALHSDQEPLALEAAAALAAFIFLTGAGSRELVAAAEELQTFMNPNSRARLLRNCADLQRRHGNRERACEMYEVAQGFFYHVGNMDGAADCIKKIADLEREAGKLQRAANRYQAAFDMQKERANLVGQAGCVAGLADIATARETYFEARNLFEEGFQYYCQADNHAGMAYCRTRLGYIALAQDQSEEARTDFEQAIRSAGKAHDLLIEASALQGLGMAELECSRLDLAEERFQKALPFFQRVDDTFGIAGCLRGLGDVARRRLDNGRAWQLYLDALQVYYRGPHWRDIAEMCRRLASVASTDEERRSYELEARLASERAELEPAPPRGWSEE